MAAAAVAMVGVAAVAADPLVVSSPGEPDIERSELTSGVRVITERMPEARSVSIGMWFAVGSRDEPGEIAGASHFLEHLLFKGTEKRSARSIALAIDAVGGEMNAYTTREHTAYYLRLPVAELHNGLELLADVVSEPAFREHELDAERDVIIEELLMSEDTPDDLVITALYESLYPDHALGRETLGSHDTVEAMTRDDLAARLRDLTATRLKVDPASINDASLFMDDLGGDSIDVVELLMDFQEAFSLKIPDEDAEGMRTFGGAVAYLANKLGL